MKTPSGFLICGVLALAACTPNQTQRPVTQAFVSQPPAIMRPSNFNPAQTTPPGIAEMSRTPGPGWVRASVRENISYSYIHEPTIVRRGDIAISWIFNNFPNPQADSSGMIVRSNMYLSEFDCIGRRSRVSDGRHFSDWGGSGQSRMISLIFDWQAVPPGSITEGGMLLACQRGTQARPPTDTTNRPPQNPGRLGPRKDPV